jgi:hypothetical protein
VSKRHSHSRRKSYGRRQHELHERRQREDLLEPGEGAACDLTPPGVVDRLAFLDPRTPRLQFALGD